MAIFLKTLVKFNVHSFCKIKTMPTIFLSIFMLLFFISLTLHQFTHSCVFKSRESSKNEHGLLDLQSHPRKLYSPKCSCGALSPKPPWIIHITTPHKNCTATVITSNLIATSHKCLTIVVNKKIQVYDTWNPRPKLTDEIVKNVVTPEMITLSIDSSGTINKIGSSSVKVKQMILSPRYVLSNIVTDGVMEDDLAFLVVNGNLFEQGYSQICIPTLEEGQNLDVIHQSAKYHDLMVLTQMRQGENSVIVSGTDCNAKLKKLHSSGVRISNDSLCVQYISSIRLNVGGSLTITSASADKRVFLAGVASSTERRSRVVPIFKLAYFTNIFRLVKYIEYQAHEADSLWCESAALKLGQKVNPPTGTKKGDWKKLKPTKDRNESLNCACGILNNATNDDSSRIAGGHDAQAYAYPWMVMLAFAFGKRKSFTCGGSIINDRMILTASHCVINKKGRSFTVATETMALSNKHNYDTDQNQRSLEVDTIYFHPDYVEDQKVGKIDHDIAIITLRKPLKFSRRKKPGGMKDVRPVCLPKLSEPRPVTPGEKATVIGWGLTNPDDINSNPEKLQKLEAPILDETQCQNISSSVNENMICAGYWDRFRDAAQGDSGGPLMVWDKTRFTQWGGQLVQIGLVSFGQDFYGQNVDPNKRTKTLGVYTNVQKFMNIIEFFAEMEGAKWCKNKK